MDAPLIPGKTLRAPNESVPILRQRVATEIIVAEPETKIEVKVEDRDEIFHPETKTTFGEMLSLLKNLGIITENDAGSPSSYQKKTICLEPMELLEEGELGWHLKRLQDDLGRPIESVVSLIELNHEVERVKKKAGDTSQLGSHSFEYDSRNASGLVSVNGRVQHRHEAKLPIFDSAVLVGDGLWESFRVQDGAILFFEEHMKRLESTARGLGIKLDHTREGYMAMIAEVLRANDMTEDCHIRFVITAGDKFTPLQGHNVNFGPQNVVIIPEHKAHTEPKPIRAVRGTTKRADSATFDPALHAISKGADTQSWLYAQSVGADEVLLSDGHGNFVAFNSTSFFLVENGTVIIPEDRQLLRGVTRQNVLRVCQQEGIPVEKRNITYMDLCDATACGATGTAGGVSPVDSIDHLDHFDVECGTIKRIQAGYSTLMNEEAKKSANQIRYIAGFSELERLEEATFRANKSTEEISRIVELTRSSESSPETVDLGRFDESANALREAVRDMNHTVRLSPSDWRANMDRYRAGTDELAFVQQSLVWEQGLQQLRSELVCQMHRDGILPKIETKKVILLSSPRNMSVLLMDAFSRRPDTSCFDEIMYAPYYAGLAEQATDGGAQQALDAKYPGFREVIGVGQTDPLKVVDEMILGPHQTDVAFFKEMTNMIVASGVDRDFLLRDDVVVVFNTRPPRDMAASYQKDLLDGSMPTALDLGYEQQAMVYKELTDKGRQPIVIDSELLLRNPEVVLKGACEAIGIPFYQEMLEVEPGAKVHHGHWGRFWYKNAVRSDGFRAYRSHTPPPELEHLVAECESHYAALREAAIGAES